MLAVGKVCIQQRFFFPYFSCWGLWGDVSFGSSCSFTANLARKADAESFLQFCTSCYSISESPLVSWGCFEACVCLLKAVQWTVLMHNLYRAGGE